MSRLHWILVVLAIIAATPFTALAEEPDLSCDPPVAMILLDRSGSMKDTASNKKWSNAKAAIKTMTDAFEMQVMFGLTTFPDPGACNDGRQTLDDTTTFITPAFSTAAAIQSKLNFSPSGSTPIVGTLTLAKKYYETHFTDKRRVVILITDGGEGGCGITGSTNIAAKMTAIATELKELKIKLFVIGFGSGVTKNQLNILAVNGGTALKDPCNLDSDVCYLQADNEAELAAALNSIAVEISEEICDGKDNNCNGLVDEGFGIYHDDLPDPTKVKNNRVQCTAEHGICALTPGFMECVSEQGSACSTEPGGSDDASLPTEKCDGLDNNCNGKVDELVKCGPDSICACGGCQTVSVNGECTTGKPLGGYCIVDQCPPGTICDYASGDCTGTPTVTSNEPGEHPHSTPITTVGPDASDNGTTTVGPDATTTTVYGDAISPFTAGDTSVASTPGENHSGCGCDLQHRASTPWGAWLLLAMLLALVVRRRYRPSI